MLLCAASSLALGVAACGGGGGNGGASSGEQAANQGTATEGKRGGKLTVLYNDDVDFIDPGATYYQYGWMVTLATQSTPTAYKPDDPIHAVPLLASALPEIAKDGKTVTVKLKQGVKFSPPVNREVTSADVKYAIERGFFNTVNSGYAGAYFGDLLGAKNGVKPGTRVRGITTPDKYTVVFKLSRGTGGVLAGALSMPLAAPVPESYARKYDKQNPSRYGQYQVATGPYMVANNAKGQAVGYQAGRRIHLVRNPNWDRSKDIRPAYLDEIDMPQGNDDATVASRQILTGSHMVNGDVVAPGNVLATATRRYKGQLVSVPAGGSHWVALNNAIPPFNDINVRKAVLAGFNRQAMLLTRGGRAVGDIPTHMIPPGVPGFDQAGGYKGPGLDFLAKPQGDMNLAAQYFKKAGFSSGKYEGKDTLLMVGTAGGVEEKAAEVAQQNLENMGFKVRLRLVTHDAMYTKYCNVPSQKVQVCPNVGWFKDFPDPQTILDPTFNGKNIIPSNNVNYSQLDVPAINKAMDRAELLTDANQRAQAWAQIDRMVTEQAPLVPWIWDKYPLIESKDVQGVPSQVNTSWDLAWTSLK